MEGVYYFDSHGCAKNQVDGELIMSILDCSGWQQTENPEEADLVIVNSCGFIESAKRESIDAVLSFRNSYPRKKILLAGCLSQRYGNSLAAELTEADALFGNRDLSRINEALKQALSASHGVILPDLDTSGRRDFAPCTYDRPLLSLPGSAYVKISEGCDNNCSFCAIPLIRGPLRSRGIPHVVQECRGLLKRGIRELCLIGQDLGSYGMDGAAGTHPAGSCLLPELLQALSSLEGDFWIRLLYIHPDNFPEPVLDLCRSDPRILPYFDLPFQHASERILRAMNRRGDSELYLDLIRRIRTALPESTVRSTFLVGFPGEGEEDFMRLMDFQDKANLDWLGVFSYSREEDTAAYNLKGRVSKKLAQERKLRIEALQTPISEARMESHVGHKIKLLVEERVENEDGLYLTRAACQAPEVDGATVLNSHEDIKPGSFVQAKIFARAGFDLDAVHLP